MLEVVAAHLGNQFVAAHILGVDECIVPLAQRRMDQPLGLAFGAGRIESGADLFGIQLFPQTLSSFLTSAFGLDDWQTNWQLHNPIFGSRIGVKPKLRVLRLS